MVTEIIEGGAPVMEKASIDEFYIDVTGLDKFYGCYKWATEMVQKVGRETGLPISFGLSVNKTVSKIATGESKPLGKMEIVGGMVRSFLNPLSIKKIPMVGDATFRLLSRIGIRQIQTLSEVPVEMLQKMLGQNGVELWRRANGIDERQVEPYRERKSLSAEHTFEEDTIDISKLKSRLTGMIEKLAFQLRDEGWLTSAVVVKIRYNNFDTHTQQSKIAYTSCDHLLIGKVEELFDKLYERRMRLRLIGVKLTGLVRGSPQINLFEDTTEMVSLYQAMDKIKKRFGFQSVRRCSGYYRD